MMMSDRCVSDAKMLDDEMPPRAMTMMMMPPPAPELRDSDERASAMMPRAATSELPRDEYARQDELDADVIR